LGVAFLATIVFVGVKKVVAVAGGVRVGVDVSPEGTRRPLDESASSVLAAEMLVASTSRGGGVGFAFGNAPHAARPNEIIR
jgi:hypothetical protein